MIKNKIITLVVAIVFLLTLCSQYAAAEADTITEAEAEALIDQSYLALARIHKNTEHWWSHTPGLEKIPSEYNTVEKMSAYFHSLFSAEIADGLWMYAAKESADERPVDDYYPEHIENGKVAIYQVNSSGFLEIADDYSQLNFGIGVVWNSDWANLLDMPKIQKITGDTEHAEALVVMSDFGWDGPPSLGVVQIKFIKEPDGWKVADSDYIDLVLERDDTGFQIHLDGKYTGGASEMLYELLGEGFIDHPYDIGTALSRAETYQFLSFDDQGMKLIYHLRNRETGEVDSWSAEFVTVSLTQGQPYSTWELEDGSLMQLLGLELPYTGDRTPQTVLLCSAAMLLSAMGAHAVLKTRKNRMKQVK